MAVLSDLIHDLANEAKHFGYSSHLEEELHNTDKELNSDSFPFSQNWPEIQIFKGMNLLRLIMNSTVICHFSNL